MREEKNREELQSKEEIYREIERMGKGQCTCVCVCVWLCVCFPLRTVQIATLRKKKACPIAQAQIR